MTIPTKTTAIFFNLSFVLPFLLVVYLSDYILLYFHQKRQSTILTNTENLDVKKIAISSFEDQTIGD